MKRKILFTFLVLAAVAGPAGASLIPGLTLDFYAGINGVAVSDLTSSAAYIAQTPSSTSTVLSAEGPTNIADNYGQAMYGFFEPALTGNYFFATASDDNSALYLSTDSNPANEVLVAGVNGWGNSREYDSPQGGGGFHSGAIPLVAGQFYAILGLQKEGGGGDNFAVTASFGSDTIANGQDPLGAGTALPLGDIFVQIPEPSTIVLAGLGAVALLLCARGRK